MTTRNLKGGRNRGHRSPEYDTTDAIASQLKQYYKSVEQEPLPSQLLDLLEKLDEAERLGGTYGAK